MNYDIKCKSTDVYFEHSCHWSELEEFLKDEFCPICGSKNDMEYVPYLREGCPVNLGISKPSTQLREKLKAVKMGTKTAFPNGLRYE